MSFWKGLGRAMESNEAQRNKEEDRADRKAEIAKADKRWETEFGYRKSKDKLAETNRQETLDRDEKRVMAERGL